MVLGVQGVSGTVRDMLIGYEKRGALHRVAVLIEGPDVFEEGPAPAIRVAEGMSDVFYWADNMDRVPPPTEAKLNRWVREHEKPEAKRLPDAVAWVLRELGVMGEAFP